MQHKAEDFRFFIKKTRLIEHFQEVWYNELPLFVQPTSDQRSKHWNYLQSEMEAYRIT